jgi:rare lipoprotein A
MKKLCILFSAFLLSGCVETELASHWWKRWGDGNTTRTASSQGSYKIGKSYQIDGKWYTPSESYSHDETGIASWYGDQFHGKRTANGETFNKNTLTAAHRTLQMPSLVRVTNLENGRSVVLRVNDRGPFAKSRIIDVSHQAANVLGFTGKGTARVRVQVLERESRILADAAKKGYPPHVQMAMAYRRGEAPDGVQVASTDLPPIPANPSSVSEQDIDNLNKQLFRKYPVTPTQIYVQVGSFSNASNAAALKQKISNLGNVNVFPSVVNGQSYNRVRVGPFASVPEADSMLSRMVSSGYPNARIIVD